MKRINFCNTDLSSSSNPGSKDSERRITNLGILCIVVCVVVCIVVCLPLLNRLPALHAADETPLPRELIVKFAAGSEGRQATEQAMQADISPKMQLEPLAQTLSGQLGIPVSISQVTSGQEVILSIDDDALMAELMQRLKERSDIEYVQPNSLMQPFEKFSQ